MCFGEPGSSKSRAHFLQPDSNENTSRFIGTATQRVLPVQCFQSHAGHPGQASAGRTYRRRDGERRSLRRAKCWLSRWESRGDNRLDLYTCSNGSRSPERNGGGVEGRAADVVESGCKFDRAAEGFARAQRRGDCVSCRRGLSPRAGNPRQRRDSRYEAGRNTRRSVTLSRSHRTTRRRCWSARACLRL